MDALQTGQSILREFGQVHGLDISLDDSGSCFFSTKHGLDIAVALADDEISFNVTSVLTPEPAAGHAKELYTALLNANLFPAVTKGGSLALDPDGDGVVYQYSFPLEGATIRTFEAFFAVFTETALGLRQACVAAKNGQLQEIENTDMGAAIRV